MEVCAAHVGLRGAHVHDRCARRRWEDPGHANYLISYSDHKVVLRNYEGYITTYESRSTTSPTTRPTASTARTRASSRARWASPVARGRAALDRAGRLRADAPPRHRAAHGCRIRASGCPTGSDRSKERPASLCPGSSRARTASVGGRGGGGASGSAVPETTGAAPSPGRRMSPSSSTPPRGARPREGEPTGWSNGELL